MFKVLGANFVSAAVTLNQLNELLHLALLLFSHATAQMATSWSYSRYRHSDAEEGPGRQTDVASLREKPNKPNHTIVYTDSGFMLCLRGVSGPDSPSRVEKIYHWEELTDGINTEEKAPEEEVVRHSQRSQRTACPESGYRGTWRGNMETSEQTLTKPLEVQENKNKPVSNSLIVISKASSSRKLYFSC